MLILAVFICLSIFTRPNNEATLRKFLDTIVAKDHKALMKYKVDNDIKFTEESAKNYIEYFIKENKMSTQKDIDTFFEKYEKSKEEAEKEMNLPPNADLANGNMLGYLDMMTVGSSSTYVSDYANIYLLSEGLTGCGFRLSDDEITYEFLIYTNTLTLNMFENDEIDDNVTIFVDGVETPLLTKADQTDAKLSGYGEGLQDEYYINGMSVATFYGAKELYAEVTVNKKKYKTEIVKLDSTEAGSTITLKFATNIKMDAAFGIDKALLNGKGLTKKEIGLLSFTATPGQKLITEATMPFGSVQTVEHKLVKGQNNLVVNVDSKGLGLMYSQLSAHLNSLNHAEDENDLEYADDEYEDDLDLDDFDQGDLKSLEIYGRYIALEDEDEDYVMLTMNCILNYRYDYERNVVLNASYDKDTKEWAFYIDFYSSSSIFSDEKNQKIINIA